MVKHLVQSIRLLFAVSAFRLAKYFTKANQLSVDSGYVDCDCTVLNEAYFGRDCLNFNSSMYANCQTTCQESILSSEVRPLLYVSYSEILFTDRSAVVCLKKHERYEVVAFYKLTPLTNRCDLCYVTASCSSLLCKCHWYSGGRAITVGFLAQNIKS